jgi:DNA processing protein
VTTIGTSRLRRMLPWDDQERATLIALVQERPQAASWPEVVAEIIEVGSAQSVWDAYHEQSLFDADTPAPIAEAARQIAGWRAAGLGVHTFRDVSYPAQLREIHQVPPVLFSRGTLCPDDPAVSVVGSRRASDQSVDWASEVSSALVSAGITVVSGLAAGIDTAAHTAALDAGGRTVAVLGTGINRVYPAVNRDLQERIACESLVVSQFWPDAAATKKSFPLRNATMSGYGRATIVVEAGETSGARIQARVGVEHGRPVILRDRVVQANEWAAALQHRPGVHIVSSVDEALGVVAALRPDLDVRVPHVELQGPRSTRQAQPDPAQRAAARCSGRPRWVH